MTTPAALQLFVYSNAFIPTTGGGIKSPTAGRRTLLQLLAGMGHTRGAEIGVWTGQFAKEICEAVPGVELLCVDPWQARDDYHEKKNDAVRLAAAYDEARDRLKPFRCSFMRMTSLEASALVPDRSLDFVYIDGNHAYEHVLADLDAWTPKVRRDGILAGHDFDTSERRPWIQVEAAVRAFTGQHLIEPWFVLAADKSPSYFWVVS